MLNKEVVTDELFHWGSRVFALSLIVFSPVGHDRAAQG